MEVIFPPFRIEPARARPPGAAGQPEFAARENVNRLVLRRGASAARDLYLWWEKTRMARASKGRTVTIRLLGEDHEQVLTTWRFSNARPVALSYTPLNALEAAVLMETIELEFDSFEML